MIQIDFRNQSIRISDKDVSDEDFVGFLRDLASAVEAKGWDATFTYLSKDPSLVVTYEPLTRYEDG